MIRRWSRVNNIFQPVLSKKNKFFPYFYLAFKKSIIFKKLRFKNTKFRRKTLIRAKHKGNWVIYHQIIKNWIFDFMVTKSYTKHQIYVNVTLFAFLVYDFALLNNALASHPSKFFTLCSHLTKKTFSRLTMHKFWTCNALPSTHSFLPSKKEFGFYNDNASILLPTYLLAQTAYYSILNENTLFDNALVDCCLDSQVFHKLQLVQMVEVYKILIYLFINRIFEA